MICFVHILYFKKSYRYITVHVFKIYFNKFAFIYILNIIKAFFETLSLIIWNDFEAPKAYQTCFYFIIINNTIDLFSIGGNMVKKGDFNLMICFDGGTFFCKFLLITGIKILVVLVRCCCIPNLILVSISKFWIE